jgi:hypothetical protein
MSTDILSLEKVDCFRSRVDGELPFSENIIGETMDWLISLDEWILVVNKAKNCQ